MALWRNHRFPGLRAAAALLLALTLTHCRAQAKGRFRRLDGSSLSSAKASGIARKALADAHVTGAQIVVLNAGKVVWSEAFGLRDVAARLPMTPDTVMQGASFTKSIFAAFVMTLVDAGYLDLDKPVWNYLGKPLPQFDRYKDLAGDVRWRKITARHLLDHTSGLANFASLEPDGKLRIHWEPGSRFGYSGEGINLLQFVVEKRMGKPLQEMMNERIFNQLGMAHTSLVWQEGLARNTAIGYDPSGTNLGHPHRTNARAAGSMDTSGEDIGRFLSGLFSGRIMTANAQNQMLQPQIPITAAHQFPTLADSHSEEGPRVGLAYGLGWGLLTATRFGPAFFKEGHGEGAQNYMICFRQHSDCMVLLTNSENGESAFRTLLEKILGDTVTPWEWESYTPAAIAESRKHH